MTYLFQINYFIKVGLRVSELQGHVMHMMNMYIKKTFLFMIGKLDPSFSMVARRSTSGGKD